MHTLTKTSLLTAITAIAALTLSACGQATEAKDNVVKVGILQQIDQQALDDTRKGLLHDLKKAYPGSKLKVTYYNANGDQSNLRTMSEQLARTKNMVNVGIATAAAQALAKADPKTPMIATAIADPKPTGLILHPEAPEANVTAVAAVGGEDQHIDLIKQAFPKTKTIGLIYNAAEPNSVVHVKTAKAEIEKLHLNVVEKPVTSTNDVQVAIEALTHQVDAIYAPADNIVAAAMATVGKLADKAKVPVVPGATTMVQLGGVFTRGTDFTAIGHQTATMVKQIVNGTPIKKIKVQYADQSKLVVNEKRMTMYGLKAANLK